MVSYHVTTIPLHVLYMFQVMWIPSLSTGNPKEQRCSKIYSQWGGDESTHQKKITYSYFWHLSPMYKKGTYLYTNVWNTYFSKYTCGHFTHMTKELTFKKIGFIDLREKETSMWEKNWLVPSHSSPDLDRTCNLGRCPN